MTLLSKGHGIPQLTQAKTIRTAWCQSLVAILVPDFITIVVFCTIGLLTMLNVILRFPDFGAIIEQYNQF